MEKITDEQLMKALSERYLALLEKDFHYQMGDDDYQLTTEEHKILTAVRTILKDIKLENEKVST